MTAKRKPKPKLTDAERHARFVDLAREVGAEDESEKFDRTVERLAKLPREADEKENLMDVGPFDIIGWLVYAGTGAYCLFHAIEDFKVKRLWRGLTGVALAFAWFLWAALLIPVFLNEPWVRGLHI